jgi:6-phosphofructokinase 1
LSAGSSSFKIGVLTGGGDAPGLNAVIRAVVHAAIGRGWEVLGIEDGFEGLFQNRVRPLLVNDVRGILQTGGTILGCSNRGNPFEFTVPRYAGEGKDRSLELIEKIERLGIAALIVIGGDGSLRIAHELAKRGVPIVGIPKTIDNDVPGTDSTFGFHTACETVMHAIDRLHTTAASHHRVMVIEVMGRDAGWIALHGGASGGGDVILIPEIPFEYESILEKIARREARGARFSLVVVAEGAYPHGGAKVYQLHRGGSTYDTRHLGGIGNVVAYELEGRGQIECRVTVLGHVQRGGSPNSFDRFLGTRFGVAAVELIAQRGFGQMVGLHGDEIHHVPLEVVTNGLKLVDPNGSLVRAIESTGVNFGRSIPSFAT